MRIRVRLYRKPGLDPARDPCDGAETPMADDPEAFELNSRTPGTMSLPRLDGSTTGPAPSSVLVAASRSRVGVGVWVGMGLIGTLLAGATGWLTWPSTAPGSAEDSTSSVAVTGRATAAQPLASAPVAGEAVGSAVSEPPARPDFDQAVAPPAAALPVSPVLPPPPALVSDAQPSAVSSERQAVATASVLPRDSLVEELERCRARREPTSTSVADPAPARIADQRPVKAKAAKGAAPAKRKAARGQRTKARVGKRPPTSASTPFWSGRQGGIFLAD
jgi:hypothetical protein